MGYTNADIGEDEPIVIPNTNAGQATEMRDDARAAHTSFRDAACSIGDDDIQYNPKNAKPRGSAHPGFAAVQAGIAKRQGIPKANAGAILAAATRRAGPAARKANPRLNRVKGY